MPTLMLLCARGQAMIHQAESKPQRPDGEPEAAEAAAEETKGGGGGEGDGDGDKTKEGGGGGEDRADPGA